MITLLKKPFTATFLLLSTLLLSLVAAIIFLGSVPPISRDALTHHLFVPKLWLQNGSIAPIPDISFSYYPMNIDLLYAVPLMFGNDIVPKYIHFSFALGTAYIIFRYLKKRCDLEFAIFGSIFFLSIPVIVKLSITAYVDLGLVFFSTLSLILLLEWPKSNFGLKYLVLAAISCGLAAGTKYNGLITVFILSLFVPVIYSRYAKKHIATTSKALSSFLIFSALAILVLSPWLIRNYTLTSNPIYPLHHSFFQTVKIDNNAAPAVSELDQQSKPVPGSQKRKNVFVTRKFLYGERWWQTLLLPVRFFTEGKDDDPRFFDGKLTPFLLVLPLFGFGRRSPDQRLFVDKAILLTYSVLFFFLVFFQESMRIRYITPVIPPLVILSTFGLQNIFSTLKKRFIPPVSKNCTLFHLRGHASL